MFARAQSGWKTGYTLSFSGQTLAKVKARGIKISSILWLVGLTLLGACSSPCRYFGYKQFSRDIFVGCRPRTSSDFAALTNCGIRTILSFETFFWHTHPERRRAEQYSICFSNIPIFASPLSPSEERVKEALLAVSDSSLRPVYIHCLYGRDRTAVILALYRIYFDGWSAQEAWDEALRLGFKSEYWTLRGFKTYFWEHTRVPEWVHQYTTEQASKPP